MKLIVTRIYVCAFLYGYIWIYVDRKGYLCVNLLLLLCPPTGCYVGVGRMARKRNLNLLHRHAHIFRFSVSSTTKKLISAPHTY